MTETSVSLRVALPGLLERVLPERNRRIEQ